MSDAADTEIEAFLRAHGPFEPPPFLSRGDTVGEWTIRAFLGRGGSAEVYRAENLTTGIVAALKVLGKSDDRTRERFKRETRLLAEMGSPLFPKCLGAGSADGRLYIAEELLEPMALPSGDLSVARLMLGIAAGVAELHRRGFVHRDIKPRNIMMRSGTGESVLADMGLAKEFDAGQLERAEAASVVDGRAVGSGTPGYSAPEQFSGGKIGPAADVHALGVLANVCFSGNPPGAWTKIIRRSTSSIPEQRFATVAEFSRAIRRRHAVRWFLACALFVCALAIGLVLFIQANDDAVARAGKTSASPDHMSVADNTKKDANRSFGNMAHDAGARQDDAAQGAKKSQNGAALKAVYDVFYGSDTNLDKEASLELMKKGLLPSY